MKILSVVGARPQFIKAAAVSRALARSPDAEEIMVHTGQHYDADMSDVFFKELGIPNPRHQLNVHGGGHGDMTGRMMIELENVMQAENPEMVLIYGDTNSTLAAALCASKLHIPVAHVEAGLRSYNRKMPEEVNRVVADHLSRYLLCPTSTAVKNLRAEGITEGVIHTGDVMYDAALFAASNQSAAGSILDQMGLKDVEFAVATIHRAENTESKQTLAAVFGFLRDQAGDRPLVFPLHPRTKQAAERFELSLDGFRTCPPLGYIDMACLVANAVEVFTDSGGLQKEAYFHRTRCTTLRDETEWTETIDAGWNRLWKGPGYAEQRDIQEYGDGAAAEKIVSSICC